MSIKNIKPDYKSKYYQSYFIPSNPDKYKGEYPIVCRSMLEHKFSSYLDQNTSILQWASEPFAIKYLNRADNKEHRYYPDFIFVNDKDKVIVEVKPAHQLKRPKPPKRKTKNSIKNYKIALKVYVTNVSKVDAVRKYADRNDYKFILITEKELKKLI